MNFFEKLVKPYFLAEIGVNHNGSLKKAIELIDLAKKSGANGVKFQTYQASKLAEIDTPKVDYQKRNTTKKESHLEMLSKLQLSYEDQISISKYCYKKKIDFVSTPYDVESAHFLLKLKVPFFKTSSADIVDILLHNYIAKSNVPVAISVGMSNYSEIEETLKQYRNKNKNIILLHCVSNYPCSDSSLNLNVIKSLKERYNLPVGFSDHSIGSEAAISATALGCYFFEKHFTDNKNSPGPDHKASSNPKEFNQLVISVNRAFKMMGNKNKKIQKEEVDMRRVSRKSPRYKTNKQIGSKVRIQDIVLKRPGDGINPQKIKLIIGKKLKKSVKKNNKLKLTDFVL